MTHLKKPILTLGCNAWGDPIVPKKLCDYMREQREMEEDRKARALLREERAQLKAEYYELRRQTAELREQRRIELENREYQRKIDRLHRLWEQAEAERKREAERQQAKRDEEMWRRNVIMMQSIENREARFRVEPDDFVSDEPTYSRFGLEVRPGKQLPYDSIGREFNRDSRNRWLYSEWPRRNAVIQMVEQLGQYYGCYRAELGRGPRPPQKQPRGWKATLPRNWSRREFVESKWEQ